MGVQTKLFCRFAAFIFDVMESAQCSEANADPTQVRLETEDDEQAAELTLNNSIASASRESEAFQTAQPAGTNGSSTTMNGNVPQDSSQIEIKLFVARVPRNYEEEQLRPEFEKFGQVLEVVILKEKNTGQHKGSAFIRMASISSADASIRALNNVRALDPSHGAMQVRYATGEAEKFGFSIDNGAPGQDMVKLFVGSLPRTISEEQVSAIFAPFGKIDEVFILKDTSTGINKGCAFVKFCYKENAIKAIKQLNGNMTIPGGPRPIEVRVAESKKTTQPTMGGAAAPFAANMMGGAARSSIPGITPGVMPGMNTMGGMGGMQMQGAQGGPNVAAAAAAAAAASNANPRQGGTWREYFNMDGRPYYHNTATNVTQWEKPMEFDQSSDRTGGDATGPPGANVFVFHVPNDWGQADLIQNFSHFGNIVSARIVTDKVTNRNKGYGFISYDNIHSAVNALTHMHGFMACGKRLKVSIKQHEEKYVQHLLPQNSALQGTGPPVQQQPQQQQQQQQQMAVAMPQGMQGGMMHGQNMFQTPGQPQVATPQSMAMLSQNPMFGQQGQLAGQSQMSQQAAGFNAFAPFPTTTSQRYAPY